MGSLVEMGTKERGEVEMNNKEEVDKMKKVISFPTRRKKIRRRTSTSFLAGIGSRPPTAPP